MIVLTGCGGAATPTVFPTNTPMAMDEPPLFTPPSAKPYAGGDEQIDVFLAALKNVDTVGTVTDQAFYRVTESTVEVFQFYRDSYASDTIEGGPPQPSATTLIIFIKPRSVDYQIMVTYVRLGAIGHPGGLLGVTVTR